MNYSVGVTTATRDHDYLPRTLRSLCEAGWRNPTVFADARTNVSGTVPSCHIVNRHKPLGLFGNWKQSLVDLMEGDTDAILLCQDDVVFCKGVRGKLDIEMWPTVRTGCVSLYCSARHANGKGLKRILQKQIWGACALLFPREAARRMLQHRVMRNWRSSRKVDILVGTVLSALQLEVWAYTPSLCQHIGSVSTSAGSRDDSAKRVASDFPGESVNVSAGGPRDVLSATNS